MAIEWDRYPTEEIELMQFLYNIDSDMALAGHHIGHAFYTAKLTEGEVVYGALKFGPAVRFFENKNESMNDFISERKTIRSLVVWM
jgi:hypothetical protein